MSISIWLRAVTNDVVANELQNVIDGYAVEYNKPVFDVHITLTSVPLSHTDDKDKEIKDKQVGQVNDDKRNEVSSILRQWSGSTKATSFDVVLGQVACHPSLWSQLVAHLHLSSLQYH
jgi:hypothetical protein